MSIQEDKQLKYDISVLLINRACKTLDCTPEEYGEVYDSEKHEYMLRAILAVVRDFQVDPDTGRPLGAIRYE